MNLLEREKREWDRVIGVYCFESCIPFLLEKEVSLITCTYVINEDFFHEVMICI